MGGKEPREMREPLWTVADLARFLGKTPGAIYQMRHRGEELPPAVKVGRQHLRWRPTDVEAWLATQTDTTSRRVAS
jgi:predicted DNA-binding transcriptional regulator AlpA